ncbi:hypothetical protein INR49_021924 [Caranx melampygus]|nr:hypothetical protein INR49_021924 [Caranx melampygus]
MVPSGSWAGEHLPSQPPLGSSAPVWQVFTMTTASLRSRARKVTSPSRDTLAVERGIRSSNWSPTSSFTIPEGYNGNTS